MKLDKDYSQFGEYTFLKEYFLDNPISSKVIVDVGAYGKAGSNSYNFLAEDNWSGILIEPTKDRFKVVVEDFKGLDVITLNLAISNYCGETTLYKSKVGDGHNSLIDADHMVDSEKVFVRDLPGILKENNIPEDFGILSVDTEGYDRLIINNLLKTSIYRPKIIISEMTCKGINSNYKLISTLGVNSIYAWVT